jgi:arylsulfatase A-like enzyme
LHDRGLSTSLLHATEGDAAMTAVRRRHLVILHTDQQRYDSLGCTGNPHALTPNIDRLAGEGLLFTRHIAANPVCMPSRASLVSGLAPQAHGVCTNGVPLWRLAPDAVTPETRKRADKMWGRPFPTAIPTIADFLKNEGYATACLGKLHLQPHLGDHRFGFQETPAWLGDPAQAGWEGPFYGFDLARLILKHGEGPCDPTSGHYGRWLRENHPEVSREVLEGRKRIRRQGLSGQIYLSPIPSELHNTMWLAEEACRVISQAEGPLCLFVGFPDPHHAWAPPADVGREFDDGPYPDFTPLDAALEGKPRAVRESLERRGAKEADCIQAYRYTNAMVHLIDRAVGRIVEGLKAKGIYDDTVVVFTSDHGDFLGDYRCLTKDDLSYRCLVHVPFVMKPARGGAAPAAGARIDAPMSNIDVLPTVFAQLGLEAPAGVQGRDVFSVREDDRRALVATLTPGDLTSSLSLFDSRFRYTLFPVTGEEELYDHEADPKELCNLAAGTSHAEARARLRAELLETHARYSQPRGFRYAMW